MTSPGAPGRPFVVRASTTVVEAWAVERLRFETAGWQVSFRAALRNAIRGLVGSPDRSLACAYESPDQALGDAENVLFYDVGVSAFTGIDVGGVIFERSMLEPLPPPAPLAGAARHYHRYEITTHREPSYWTPGPMVAAFASAPFGEADSPSTVAAAITDGQVQVRREPGSALLCVRATVSIGTGPALYPALQPLLGGVLAAFAVPDADHRLVAADLRVEPGPSLRISGELFEARPL